MNLLPKYAVTVRQIAIAEGLHEVTIARISLEPDFPKPLARIGRAKIYNGRQVAKFFRKRFNKAA